MRRVLREPEFGHDLIEFRQEGDVAPCRCITTQQTQLRQEVACDLQGDEDRGNRIGHDQNAILRHLRIGDALHPAEHRIGENDRRTDVKAGIRRHFEEAREGHAHTAHLADHIGHRDDDQADDGDKPCTVGIEPVTDEFGHCELAELAQVRGQQQCQKHVTACPAHQEGRLRIAARRRQRDDPRHRDERRRRHPVCRRRHAVHDRGNTLPGRIEFRRRARTGPDRDADVERKGCTDHQQVECILIHFVPVPFAYSSTPNSASSLFMRQA